MSPFSPSSAPRAVAALLQLGLCGALASACGDDAGDAAATGDATGSDSGASTSPSTTTPGTDTDTSAGATTTETGADACADSPLAAPTEVVLYPEQPLIADLLLTPCAPGAADGITARVPGDPIARGGPAPLEPPDAAGRRRVRVRGLAPAAPTTIELWDPARADAPVEVLDVTLPPATDPGFQLFYPVRTDPRASTQLRLFDIDDINTTTARIVTMDAAGRVRFDLLLGPAAGNLIDAVPAGLHLRADGSMAIARDGKITLLDERGRILAERHGNEFGHRGFHHEVITLPNGNLLTLGSDFRPLEPPTPRFDQIAGDVILELTPDLEEVWRWSTFDHLDPTRINPAPEAAFPVRDPREGDAALDWTHCNGLEYDPRDGSVLLSSRHQSWIIKIDLESGAVVWRLGDEGDFTLADGRWFYFQHSSQWQADGTLLLYDNGIGNPNLEPAEVRSRPMIMALDETAMTATIVWEETLADPFIAFAAGDADRMSNGNILVTDSSVEVNPPTFFPFYGRIREVVQASQADVWGFEVDVGKFIYRAVPTDRLPGEPLP